MPVLLIAYPLLAHLAVVHHEPLLQWLALVCLVAAPLYPALKSLRPVAWIAFALLVALLYGVMRAGGGAYALYLPPIVLPAVLLAFFGGSLLPGRTPLITRIATLERGSLPPPLIGYTRAVTAVWSMLFATMMASSLLLALFASPLLWSLFTNFINYLACGALFLLEYLYRRWRYRDLEHAGFIDHLRLIARTDYRKV